MGGRRPLTVYDKTQGVMNTRDYVSKVFGFDQENVRVVAPYMGGAFGSGLRPEYQLFLAVMAAKALEAFGACRAHAPADVHASATGPHTIQRLKLGADANGKLQAMMHDAFSTTSRYEEYTENIIGWSSMLYDATNSEAQLQAGRARLRDADAHACARAARRRCTRSSPPWTSSPYALGIDPLELRLRNYAETDRRASPSRARRCASATTQGAERFGWSRATSRAALDARRPRCSSAGAWRPACGRRCARPASARVVLTTDGTLEVACAMTDIGTGTYTMVAQIAADMLGVADRRRDGETGRLDAAQRRRRRAARGQRRPSVRRCTTCA